MNMNDQELDALIAKKVMGLNVSHDGNEYIVIDRGGKESTLIAYHSVQAYSTDMRMAWQVAEKVIHDFPGHEPVMIWRSFESPEPYGPSGYSARIGATGPTGWGVNAARALCLAAFNVFVAEHT